MNEIDSLLRVDAGFLGGIRLRMNALLTRYPAFLQRFGATLTVFDSYRGLGDTLLTGIACRILKERFPGLRINCITYHPELLKLDPHIDTLNAPETYFCIWFQYHEIIERRETHRNALDPVLSRAGIRDYHPEGRVYLSGEEKRLGLARIGGLSRPVITINTLTKEPSKNWPSASWRELIGHLRRTCSVVHLGGDDEPAFEGTLRLAGTLSPRESMAVVAAADLHVGGDSFLAHAAAGLSVPAVVILGGSRGPGNLPYPGIRILSSSPPCSPCFIQATKGEQCPHDLKCLTGISVERVLDAVGESLRKPGGAIPK